MENFISELTEVCKLPFLETFKDFKVIQLGTKGIYVSNFQKLIDYSVNKIVLKVPTNTLEISGNNLKINQMNKREIVVAGKIHSICLGVIHESEGNN